MEKMVQKGYLLLADISGFDAYITKVELDHAKGVIKDLLELIVEGLTPALELASFEGDAVLTYAVGDNLPSGEFLLETIESTYVEFREHLQSIERNNSCECMACQDAPTLDLKFLLHYGEYSLQTTTGGGIELGGLDANLVRDRLLKDQVEPENGTKAYLLLTEQGLAQMGLALDRMQENRATYPHLGEIRTARLDLRMRYEEFIKTHQTSLSENEATFIMSHDFSVPPKVLWHWLNDTSRRSTWMKWRTWKLGRHPWGRRGIGSENHCAHGLGTIVETVVDWKPYSEYSVRSRQESIHYSMLQTFHLMELSDGAGTRLRVLTQLSNKGPLGVLRALLQKGLERLWTNDYQRLEQLIRDNNHPSETRFSVAETTKQFE